MLTKPCFNWGGSTGSWDICVLPSQLGAGVCLADTALGPSKENDYGLFEGLGYLS